MKEPDYAGRGEAFTSTAARSLARLGYLLIALAVVCVPLGLIAAASGRMGLAAIAGGIALLFLIVGGALWAWQARRKDETHPETSDRQISGEGKGPLDI